MKNEYYTYVPWSGFNIMGYVTDVEPDENGRIIMTEAEAATAFRCDLALSNGQQNQHGYDDVWDVENFDDGHVELYQDVSITNPARTGKG